MTRLLAPLLIALTLCSPVCASVVIGSKSFTESAILGHMLRILAEDAGAEASFRSFPGSAVAYNALLAGEIDAYPEYTGTLKRELLAEQAINTDDQLRAALEQRGLAMTRPIGFNNTYAVGVTRETAERYGLSTISDLADHPDLRLAFSTEFMNRADGWPGLRDAYRLGNAARGIEHSLAYGALAAGAIDATDLYATDAQIAAMGLVVLDDDRGYFPRYDAVVLYRRQLAETHPEVVRSFRRMAGALDAESMRRLNERAEIGDDGGPRVDPAVVAADAARERFGIDAEARVDALASRLIRRTKEHLTLVGVSMLVALALALPLGVLAARSRTVAGPTLALVGVLQTIPAIALLVLLIKPFGIGAQTAIVALVLYSLLPIVRNTHSGLTSIPGDLIESANAIGLSPTQRLLRVELPLALPTIMAGIKTAVVINVGAATLGGFISAGGYGQPIFTGITQNNFSKILEGAVPAAILAIAAQFAFDALERVFVSRGLRL
ncbi:MAG: glycine betaine ABC transporter substrate-binding protein [Phycisphaerales bacterium]